MDMNVNETADGVTHVALDGRFDIAGAQEVDGRFAELADKAKILVVDLSKVTFLASLGVRTLMVSARTIIRRGAYVAVAGANEGVEKVLRLTGFDELVRPLSGFGLGRRGSGRKGQGVREPQGITSEGALMGSRDFPGTVEAAADAEAWLARETGALGLADETTYRDKPLRRGVVPQRRQAWSGQQSDDLHLDRTRRGAT